MRKQIREIDNFLKIILLDGKSFDHFEVRGLVKGRRQKKNPRIKFMYLKLMDFKRNHKLNYGETSLQKFTRVNTKIAERCSLSKFKFLYIL